MNLDTYVVGVKFEIDKASLRDAQKALDNLQKQASKTFAGAGGSGGSGAGGGKTPNSPRTSMVGVAEFGAAVLGANEVMGFFASSIQLASEFEAKMMDVKLAGRLSASEFAEAQKKAAELGATTSFTSYQAAEAIENLLKNGISYKDVMGGVLDATINLSLAMGSDLAGSANLLTDVLNQFHLKASDAAKAADILTGATFASKFGFDDMRLAVAQVGGVAGAVGMSFEDLSLGLALTSSAFSGGSDAGTSFKTFLTTLNPATKPATAAMRELGIITKDGQNQFFTATGGLKSMAEIADVVRVAFKGLSDEQRIEYAHTIAGTDAMRTLLTIADSTASSVRNLGNSIGELNTAEIRTEKAELMKTKIQEMSSAWEGFKMSLVDAGTLDFLKSVTLEMTNIVNLLNESGGVSGLGHRWGKVLSEEMSRAGGLFTGAANFGHKFFGGRDIGQIEHEYSQEKLGKLYSDGKERRSLVDSTLMGMDKTRAMINQGALQSSTISDNRQVSVVNHFKQTFTNADPSTVERATRKGADPAPVEQALDMMLNGA